MSEKRGRRRRRDDEISEEADDAEFGVIIGRTLDTLADNAVDTWGQRRPQSPLTLSSNHEGLQNVIGSPISPPASAIDTTAEHIDGFADLKDRIQAFLDNLADTFEESEDYSRSQASHGSTVTHSIRTPTDYSRPFQSPRAWRPETGPTEVFQPPPLRTPVREPEKSSFAAPAGPPWRTLRRVGRLVDIDGRPVPGFPEGWARAQRTEKERRLGPINLEKLETEVPIVLDGRPSTMVQHVWDNEKGSFRD
ncbi:MAG: hypothetical protein Q9181_002491 [Wetmoreana brouardii]